VTVLLEASTSEHDSADLADELLSSIAPDVPVVGEAAGPSALAGEDEQLKVEHETPDCVVPGCDRPGKHKLGVRCRVWHEPSPIPGKSKTSALWAPDSNAFLCDRHALSGALVTLIYEPNDSGETVVRVIAAPQGNDRRTPIRREREAGDPSAPG